MFHRHNWQVLSEQIIDSPLERLKKLANGRKMEMEGSPDLCMGTHVVILKCACGKIKKIVTKI